ncbi:MAG: PA-phosphatase, partial [Panacibacter sp.]
MKKVFFYLFISTTITLTYFGCSKDIHGRTDDLPALNPANIDIDAGFWKPVLLSRPDSFAVAAPVATNLPGYIGELNEIKGLQANLSGDERSKIKYWSAGAVLRFNEIMRELVAKYNLAPYQNEDGTYPTPSSGNPFAYPQFPFSNPPYSSRAFAYISASQYDALVACWYFKKLYNRAPPYKVDSTIGANAIAVKTDLPSYPSEQAVLAGVTAEMMKMFFPTEIAYINAKVDELQTATMASGACVRSDWVAGEALGRQIASVFAARGRTDNTSKAVGTPTQWDSLAIATAAKGEIPWHSLETPARPPMLPFFGNVKPFLFDSLIVVNVLRPGPPPSTNSDEF